MNSCSLRTSVPEYRINLTRLPVSSFLGLTGYFGLLVLAPVILFLKLFRIPLRLRETIRDDLEFIPAGAAVPSEIEGRRNELVAAGFCWLGLYEVRGGAYPSQCGLLLLQPAIGAAITRVPPHPRVTGSNRIVRTTIELISYCDGVWLNTMNTGPGMLNDFPQAIINVRIAEDVTAEKMLETHRRSLLEFFPGKRPQPLDNAATLIDLYRRCYKTSVDYWLERGYLRSSG